LCCIATQTARHAFKSHRCHGLYRVPRASAHVSRKSSALAWSSSTWLHDSSARKVRVRSGSPGLLWFSRMQPAVSDSGGEMRYKHPCNRNPPSDASDVKYSTVLFILFPSRGTDNQQRRTVSWSGRHKEDGILGAVLLRFVSHVFHLLCLVQMCESVYHRRNIPCCAVQTCQLSGLALSNTPATNTHTAFSASFPFIYGVESMA